LYTGQNISKKTSYDTLEIIPLSSYRSRERIAFLTVSVMISASTSLAIFSHLPSFKINIVMENLCSFHS